MDSTVTDIRDAIGSIKDYPKPGIIFRDITPLLQNTDAFQLAINTLRQRYSGQGITQIAAIEARGFIFGSALAYAMGCGLTLLRKPGKLPGEVVSQSYQLEYGSDELQMHQNALTENDRVLIVDDLLATGGTVVAANQLIASSGAEVIEAAFVVSLPELGGEDKLQQSGVACYTLCQF
ncbi:adenine phosphoribosyltransferase [Idiomarina sp. HP20-50]|uniref:adenine phosphoribosyltransferase n=1 Tax=Idiomarina sp. HP20-50 TaxID=3070813 RepID=UPI00294B64F6|nr:adenine phosphoribosyltransferase [Idiomarina sp. HP20-50]MDV6317159.1 adenine phosphoribosyltransferase [Idiomarina sp. HP20-50]